MKGSTRSKISELEVAEVEAIHVGDRLRDRITCNTSLIKRLEELICHEKVRLEQAASNHRERQEPANREQLLVNQKAFDAELARKAELEEQLRNYRHQAREIDMLIFRAKALNKGAREAIKEQIVDVRAEITAVEGELALMKDELQM